MRRQDLVTRPVYLSSPQVYPLVTLVAAKTSAVLLTNLPTPSLVPAPRPAQVFGYPGAVGIKYGQCQVQAASLPALLPPFITSCLPSWRAFLAWLASGAAWRASCQLRPCACLPSCFPATRLRAYTQMHMEHSHLEHSHIHVLGDRALVDSMLPLVHTRAHTHMNARTHKSKHTH